MQAAAAAIISGMGLMYRSDWFVGRQNQFYSIGVVWSGFGGLELLWSVLLVLLLCCVWVGSFSWGTVEGGGGYLWD